MRARNIFDEPSSDQWKLGHQLECSQETFLPIKLPYNHWQSGESRFADLLKRIARGIKTEDDLELLRSRVFPENDARIPEDTFYIFLNRGTIPEYNEKNLDQVDGPLEVLQATDILATKRQFEPKVDEKDGKVIGTPLVNTLYLKKGAKVILIYNLDVSDGLNNGAKGLVMDFIRNGD